jgi:prepilin-type N-terminal cleavage/methylation domain-containing protein
MLTQKYDFIARDQKNCQKYNKKLKFYNGFSLTELSIVIIIISLIVVAATQGVKLVDQAKLYRIYKNVELQKKYINSFYKIYNYYPGDLPNACSNNSASLLNYNCANNFNIFRSNMSCIEGSDNCNGDGKIRGEESFRALKDLEQAEFFNESYSGTSGTEYISDNTSIGKNIISSFYNKAAYTPMMTSESIHISPYKQANFNNRIITILGKKSNGSNKIPTFPVFTPMQASQFDRKYDDGKPWSGDIRVYITNDSDKSYPPQINCVTGITESDTYNILNSDVVCTMIFALDTLNEF